MEIVDEAKKLFNKMRDATLEEQECIDNYIKDISIPTDVKCI